MTKPRTQSYGSRLIATRDEIQRFLIVCEGEKTEPNYFRKFRVPREVIEIHGTGYNTVSLIQEAIRLRDKVAGTNAAYDQVWCVFDHDSFPPDNINEAFKLAEEKTIQVAFSNEAFEIWYLLHFAYHESALSRSQYKEKLTASLGCPYVKNSETIYETLFNKQADAIRNAKKLPERANPSTTVYKLVEELNRFLLR